MKNRIQDIDATPSKRIYLSIISDYDLSLALCELIDNAIDSWTYNGQVKALEVKVILNYQQQTIEVSDNSGGIPESEMKLVISPGESRNEIDTEVIGLFGVGSKRAVVALAQQIKIYSRYKNNRTTLVEFDDNWIADPDWNITIYEADTIAQNTTIIELTKLRDPINSENEKRLINHLGATYSQFISKSNFSILLNSKVIEPIVFESWSFPPNFEPKHYEGKVSVDNKEINFDIIAGLTKQGDPAGGEYGLYLYCNDRLISRAHKGYEVGYKTSMAGQPHPSISLVRVIVRLNGGSQLMPWNSSKSEINTKSHAFKALENQIMQIITNYSRASRSMADDWATKVFPYKTGDIKQVKVAELTQNSDLHLVPIPRKANQKYIDVIKRNNKSVATKKPWVKGTYEALIAVEEVSKLNIEQNNRISLLILDSTLEIAFKDYLANETPANTYAAGRLATIMGNRATVHNEIAQYVRFKKDTWTRVNYYYNLRCELVHKRVAVTITDEDLKIYRDLCEYMFKKMFGLNFQV
ncbi:ATP-binding protein [Mariniflexile sp.]|uniref:ATP-binding protein n=1 Tax=Mariniflexile sp. TaxID=1979402 RepID=UPI004048CB9B